MTKRVIMLVGKVTLVQFGGYEQIIHQEINVDSATGISKAGKGIKSTVNIIGKPQP